MLRLQHQPVWILAPVLCLLLIGVSFGCSGDRTTDQITYVAENPNAPDNSVTLNVIEDNADNVLIAVQLREWADRGARRIEFTLTYDPDIVTFDEFLPGIVLERVGTPSYDLTVGPGSDRLHVVAQAIDASEAISGSGNLVQLRFRPAGTGTTFLDYRREVVRKRTNPNGELVTGISWYAGQITAF